MLSAILALIAGLLISGVAIYYSVAGLVNIFAAAAIPIIIMGTSLEVAKLVATVWLKQNWSIAPKLLRAYLIGAVAILMAITSMGIFGFLSKAHSDQNLVSDDVQAKIEIYDQKIQTARENIEANRRALTQLDATVDQTLGRSTDTEGAVRAVNIRRSQKTERIRLLQEIEKEQATIAKLTEEAAPIKAQARQVEAKVGPIKYIAQMIYGDNPDANLLEKSVSWMIIMIVIVFDPLALALLLASQYSFQQARKKKEVQAEDKFVETFFESRGTVDPDINLEFDEPSVPDESFENDKNKILSELRGSLKKSKIKTEESDFREIFEQIEERTVEDAPVFNPELPEATTKITHTPEGMIIEDSAGVKEIPHKPAVSVLSKDYLTIDGQTFHYKSYDPDSNSAQEVADSILGTTYVQNEEQAESSVWSKIMTQKPITEEQYLEQAKNHQKKDADEQ